MSNMRELLKRTKTLLSLINMNGYTRSGESINLYRAIEKELEKPKPAPEPINIEWPDYNYQYMDSGLDELKITDTHEAMRYGWECALECVAEALPDKLYTHPPEQQKPKNEIL